MYKIIEKKDKENCIYMLSEILLFKDFQVYYHENIYNNDSYEEFKKRSNFILSLKEDDFIDFKKDNKNIIEITIE